MKNFAFGLIAGILLLGPSLAFGDSISFDPTTREGRALAYAALNESNALGNAQRLLKNLNSLSRSSTTSQSVKDQAQQAKPALEALIKTLSE